MNPFNQKTFSIYITDDLIRIIEGQKTGSNIYVSKIITTPTPPDSFDDGLITDINKVASAIAEALGKKEMSKAKLYFTVYSRKIAAKEIEMPYIKKLELIQAMIDSNVNEYFPMSNMDDYITRFTILDTVEKEGRKNLSIVVYAVLKDLVSSYVELAKTLKMPLVSIDYQVNSLYNLVKRQSRQSTGNRQSSALFLQIDDDVTHISIFRGPSQLFRRSVPYGVDTLAQALASALAQAHASAPAGALASAKGIDEKEARAILLNQKNADGSESQKHQSVAALREEQETVLLDDYLTADEYEELMQDYLASITRVINFFISKNPDITLEKTNVIGSGVRISYLGKTLENILGMPVEMVKSLHGVHIRKDKGGARIHNDDLTDFLPNIGAFINPLNLRLSEEVRFTKGGIGYGLLFFLVFLAIAGVGGAVGFIWWQQAELDAEKNSLRRNIEGLRHGELVYNEYVDAGRFRDLIDGFNQSTRNENEALYQLILTLEEIMPRGVRVAQLSAADGKVDLTMSSSVGKLGVARMIIELKEIPWIDNVWVGNIRDAYDVNDRAVSSFPISFTISNDLLEALGNEEEGGNQ